MDLRNFALGALREAFHACGIENCEKRSIGFACSRCGDKICQRHHYLSPPDPADPVPRVVCVSCIVEEREHEQAFVVGKNQERR